MISELVFTAILSICSIQLEPEKPFDELELESFSNDFSETYRVDENCWAYIAYYQEEVLL